MGHYINQLIVLFVLVLFSGFFSASETAIISIGRLKLEELAERKRPGSKSLGYLHANPSMMLSTVLIGNNFVNITASALATTFSISFLNKMGFASLDVVLGIVIGAMTFLILVFGEIIPKTIAIRNAERIALFSAPIIWFLSMILYPLVSSLILISTPFVVLFGGRMPKRGPFLTKEEIKMLLTIGEKEGIIEEEEREMISSIFEFGKTVVREVMTPKPDMQCIDVSDPMGEAISLVIEGGHSRIPVFEGNVDNIIGVIYAKDILKAVLPAPSQVTIRELLRPALFVPPAKRVDDLMHEMQAARTHVAVVVDEYGQTAGLVSMEDLVEEIVGEIYDEFEKSFKMTEKIDEKTTIIDARLNIADVNKMLEIALPEKDYDTLGGFIFGKLGKVPAVGDSVRFDDVLLSVERVHKRRISRAKIMKLPKRQEEEADQVGG
jgi:CBS domain containing-hemolysin-like protein